MFENDFLGNGAFLKHWPDAPPTVRVDVRQMQRMTRSDFRRFQQSLNIGTFLCSTHMPSHIAVGIISRFHHAVRGLRRERKVSAQKLDTERTAAA